MAQKHYHVLVGMPGYMPETNEVYQTLRDARDAAQWHADTYRDDWDPGYKVTGNKRDGYEIMPRDASIYTLPTTITIVECYEPECLEHRED